MGTGASILEVPAGADRAAVRQRAIEMYGPEIVAKVESEFDQWVQAQEADDDAEIMDIAEAKQAGADLGKILKKKAPEGQKLEKHSALVFDCGTGETKAIFLQFEVVDGRKTIVVEELNKAPAVLDFLHNKLAEDNEDYKTLRSKASKIADEAQREQALQRLRDGFWFLDEKPADAGDKLESKHFVAFCVQTKKKLADRKRLPDTVMIGTSAWARAAALEHKSDQLIKDLTKVGLLCKKLLQTQEGTFEAAAVGYAYGEIKEAGEPDQFPELTGVIGSGGGSVQFMHSMKYRTSGWRWMVA
jgi:hypothetical protein